MDHVYWQTTAVFTNVIDNVMNHVYSQTKLDYEPCLLANNAVFTNAIGNITIHVYWQTIGVFTNVIDNIMKHVYWQTRVAFPMPLIIV